MNNPEYLKRFKIDSDSENESKGKIPINTDIPQQSKLVKDSTCNKIDKDKSSQNIKKTIVNPLTKDFLDNYKNTSKQPIESKSNTNAKIQLNSPQKDEEYTQITQEIEEELNSKPFHHLQVIDEDVENFKRRLEILTKNFKTDTLNDFMSIKRNLLTEQKQVIDGEKQKSEAIISAKNNQIENLKEALASTKVFLNNETEIKERLSKKLFSIKNNEKLREMKTKAFNIIKERFLFKKKSNSLIDKINKNIVGFNLKRKLFNIIKNTSNFEKQERLINEKEKLFNHHINDISVKYNKEINELRSKLEEANSMIGKFKEQKYQIQENLKKTLMKNVVAMNFEAMNILDSDNLENTQNNIINQNIYNNLNSSQVHNFGVNSNTTAHNQSMYNTNIVNDKNENSFIQNNLSYNIETYENKSQSKDSNWINASIVPMKIKDNIILKSNTGFQNYDDFEETPNAGIEHKAFHSTFGNFTPITQQKDYSQMSNSGIPYDEMKHSKFYYNNK